MTPKPATTHEQYHASIMFIRQSFEKHLDDLAREQRRHVQTDCFEDTFDMVEQMMRKLKNVVENLPR